MNDLTSKSKLRDIAEDLTGTRPTERTLPNIVSYIEKNAEIVYEKEPHTFKGRLRELGYALNGVRPTQRSTRGIINNIVENYEGGGGATNKIYGVSGLTTESPYLTRTDDAVNMNWQKNIDGTVTSDFDNVFPYKKMKRVTINDNVLVLIPSMWFRIGTDGYNITDIAVSGKRGEGDNWYQTKEFYYGAYCGGRSNKLVSKTNQRPDTNKTISILRVQASANGEYYQQLDLYHKTIMNFLWWIEFANKNSDLLFPMSLSTKVSNAGATDSISTPTGFVDNRLKWHNIEDFVGNVKEFVEGISPDDAVGYATTDPSKFNQNYKTWDRLNYLLVLPPTDSCCVKTLGWDKEHPFLCMPTQIIVDETYSTYFCDEYNAGSGSDSTTLQCGKDYNWGNRSGVSSCIFANPTATFDYVGARLLYCPNGV